MAIVTASALAAANTTVETIEATEIHLRTRARVVSLQRATYRAAPRASNERSRLIRNRIDTQSGRRCSMRPPNSIPLRSSRNSSNLILLVAAFSEQHQAHRN